MGGKRPTRGYFGPATILNLYRIAHSESTVDKWELAAPRDPAQKPNDCQPRRSHKNSKAAGPIGKAPRLCLDQPTLDEEG
jgi:hypothetical protein